MTKTILGAFAVLLLLGVGISHATGVEVRPGRMLDVAVALGAQCRDERPMDRDL